MEVVEAEGNEFKIRLSGHELMILKNVLSQACESISAAEFQTRLGRPRKEAKNLLLLLSQYLNNQREEIKISRSEVEILRGSFVEICYGIKIENFEDKIGTLRDDANKFLSLFKEILESSEMKNVIIDKKISEEQLDSSSIRGEYYLEADGYKLIFYLGEPKVFGERSIFFPIVIALKINTVHGEVSSRTIAFRIILNDLYSLITYLEEHMKNITNKPLTIAKQFFINRAMLQMQALPGKALSSSEGFFSLNTMINVSDRSDDEGFFMGAEAAISFAKANEFITTLKTALDKLSF
jgi:hypothetical protein